MNTKFLMSASSLFMGPAGIAFLFLPEEFLSYIDLHPSFITILFIQIFGGLYLGFAVMNWMARGNLIGGIYSKPVAMGNFAHFFIGGLTLLKAAFSFPEILPLWLIASIYGIFATLFALVAFGNPISKKTPSD
ncbi:MAG: hypothetical protein ABJH08_01980 [Balneola sp.]